MISLTSRYPCWRTSSSSRCYVVFFGLETSGFGYVVEQRSRFYQVYVYLFPGFIEALRYLLGDAFDPFAVMLYVSQDICPFEQFVALFMCWNVYIIFPSHSFFLLNRRSMALTMQL